MRSGFSRDYPRFRQQQPSTDKHRINRDITALEVRVIGSGGEQLGVLRTRDAIQKAEEEGLDLVEVAGTAKPPVCKILDYGKLKYREQKKEAALRKNTGPTVKEIRVRYNTDKHDLETKMRNAKKFILEGDRVRFEMRFKGREASYQDLGKAIFQNIIAQLSEVAVVEESTPLIGLKMILVFVPKGHQKEKEKVVVAGGRSR